MISICATIQLLSVYISVEVQYIIMTTLAISHGLRSGNIIHKMESDLIRVSTILKSDQPTNFSTITLPSTKKMGDLLAEIYQLSLTLTKAIEKKKLYRLLRHLLLLFDTYKENMWPFTTRTRARTALADLDDAIRALSKSIGVVPHLNSQIILSEKKFLP
jgi:hypothetical protein